MGNSENLPNFRSKEWLQTHVFNTLDFYYPRCIDDQRGTFYQSFRDDGEILDQETKHLVGTSRFVFIFSVGSLLGGPESYFSATEFGLRALVNEHTDKKHGGYLWLLGSDRPDSTKHAYGHAFVLLAAAMALKSGVSWAADLVYNVFDVLEEHFWDASYGLYRDEYSGDWGTVSPYRGQNANMHMCEAMLMAFEATEDTKFLNRSYELANNVVQKYSTPSNGWIWEHYNSDWEIDWDYNKSDPKNLFRPYGYLPGHFVEWSKLLLILERYKPEPWMLRRAVELYQVAMNYAWDKENGGIFYTLDPQGEVLDTDKYYWVMAEAIAASALLGNRTGEEMYWSRYDELWEYSYKNLVDRENGGWYRVLNQNNIRYSNVKSPPSKTDYHPVGACYEVLRSSH